MQLLAQLTPASNAVNRAMVCFGSVCKGVLMPDARRQPPPLVVLNQKALTALQNEISGFPEGPIPIFLASIVLAAAEVLLRRMQNALMHTRGAFKSLEYIRGQRFGGSSALAEAPVLSTRAPDQRQSDSLFGLSLSLDMQIAWYRTSEPPDLPQTFDLSRSQLSVCGLVDTDAKMITFLHSCYHFANRVSDIKYRPRASLQPSLVLEQSRYTAVLSDWLEKHDPPKTSQPTCQALILQVQCLSTMIYLSTILQPYECAYDTFTKQFSQILDLSAQIMSFKDHRRPNSTLPTFQLQTGIFQPLYFMATKCRHPRLRRRAVNLLLKAGVEGPWNAQMMAALAQKVIAVEEKRSFDSLGLEVENLVYVAEKQRIYGSGPVTQSIDLASGHLRFQAQFSMCKDMEALLRAPESESRERHWNVWTEEIGVQTYLSNSSALF